MEIIFADLKNLTKNSQSNAQEFQLRIDGPRTQLIDFRTKQPIEYKHEINQVKELLDKVPAKTREKAWQMASR
jgi:hypothetical protein